MVSVLPSEKYINLLQNSDRFDVIGVVNMEIFWDGHHVVLQKHFRGTCCLHLQCRSVATLKRRAEHSYETLVPSYQATQHPIQGDWYIRKGQLKERNKEKRKGNES